MILITAMSSFSSRGNCISVQFGKTPTGISVNRGEHDMEYASVFVQMQGEEGGRKTQGPAGYTGSSVCAWFFYGFVLSLFISISSW